MKLKEARESAKMTIQALADAVGVTPAAICRYENGLRTPKIHIAKRIGEKLNIPWYEIMDIDKTGK